MTRKDPQLNLRLPADLKEMLESSAEESNRSLTAETVERLRASYSVERNSTQTLFMLSRLEMRLAECQMESLRYYQAALGLFQYLQIIEKLQKDHGGKIELSDEAANKMENLLVVSNRILKTDKQIIDAVGLFGHLAEEHEKLKHKSESMFDEMLKATKK